MYAYIKYTVQYNSEDIVVTRRGKVYRLFVYVIWLPGFHEQASPIIVLSPAPPLFNMGEHRDTRLCWNVSKLFTYH